jgi:hypothetical protein
MSRISQFFLLGLMACGIPCSVAAAARDVDALIAVVASPDSTWEDRAVAEESLARLPREIVLRKIVPELKDHPDGPDYGEPFDASVDKDAPPEWLAYFSTWRVWKAHLPDVDITPELESLTADLLPLAKGTSPRVAVARLAGRYWSNRSEETLARWLRDGRAGASVRNQAAAALLRHRRTRYFAEVRGLLDSSPMPSRELLFTTLVNATPGEEFPDPVVTSIGFELLVMRLARQESNVANRLAGLLEVHLGVNFQPDEEQPVEPKELQQHRKKTIDNARAWWKANGRRIEEEAAKLRPRSA